ncbi:hypothetical protein BJ170DRAFT_263748 [Xylariales sp. AK1849]|nr:hypothetical protein BJ170DRAFT_263748 [Xylariales sp. AK1849]
MLFAEADAPHLKAWIIKRLANTSDADADVLADYVLALLRHDGDVDTIRKVFDEEIPDFLREDAAAFTDDVFQVIKYQSYLPGAPPPPPINRQPLPQALHTSQIPLGPASQLQSAFPPAFPNVQHTPYVDTPSAFSSSTFRNGSRKRSYRDLDAPEAHPMSWDSYNGGPYQQGGPGGHPYKQARRGGDFTLRGGRFDNPYTPSGRGGYPPSAGNPAGFPGSTGNGDGAPGYSPHQPFPPPQQMPGRPPIDPASIIENIQRLQELGAQMGIQMPQAGGHLPKPVYSGSAISTPPPHQKRRPCRDYERKGFCSRGNRCQFEHGSGSVYVPAFSAPPPAEEYDPNNATMAMPIDHPSQPPRGQDKFHMPPQSNRQDFKKPRRRGGRTSFSAEGPSRDKTNTKIVVENVPEEDFTEDEIRSFFNQFGTIDEVTLHPPQGQKRIAIVKFDSWASANAAWKSPKVVFNNRFVKVYWYKDDSQLGSDAKHTNGARNGSANGEGASADPEFDAEEFRRKQEEAQKVHLEKTQKREALERERQELEGKRKELAAKQQEEKRRLLAKLSANGVKEASLSPILTKSTLDGETKPSQAEALRAKLAALEQEAESVGLDPHDAGDESSSWPPRGRGRGRRPYRGRGSFPPRSYRGGYSYRGRGGAAPDVHTAYAQYSLDNRPKIIALKGVDFTEPSKDEALRQYLFGIGEFTAISTDPTTTYVTFKDRKTAEQLMFGVSANKTIPGVEGTVELTWTTSAPKTVGADSDLHMASGLEEEHSAKAPTEVEESSGFGGTDVRDQGDMDYEGGDWDI